MNKLRYALVITTMLAVIGYFQFCDTTFPIEATPPTEEGDSTVVDTTLTTPIMEDAADTAAFQSTILPYKKTPTAYQANDFKFGEKLKGLLPTRKVVETEIIYRDTCFAANQETAILLQKDKEIEALLKVHAEKDAYSAELQATITSNDADHAKEITELNKQLAKLNSAKLYEGLSDFPSGKVKWLAIVEQGILRGEQPTLNFITPTAVESPIKGQHYLGASYLYSNRTSFGGLDYNYLLPSQKWMFGGGVGVDGQATPYVKANFSYRIGE